jgi:hypothetical protein
MTLKKNEELMKKQEEKQLAEKVSQMKKYYNETLKKDEKIMNSTLFAQISMQEENEFHAKEKALKQHLAQED